MGYSSASLDANFFPPLLSSRCPLAQAMVIKKASDALKRKRGHYIFFCVCVHARLEARKLVRISKFVRLTIKTILRYIRDIESPRRIVPRIRKVEAPTKCVRIVRPIIHRIVRALHAIKFRVMCDDINDDTHICKKFRQSRASHSRVILSDPSDIHELNLETLLAYGTGQYLRIVYRNLCTLVRNEIWLTISHGNESRSRRSPSITSESLRYL